MQVIRILFEHAMDLGWIEYNPARRDTIKSTSPPRLPWPELIEAYRNEARGRELLLFEMCLATGQRIQDVLDMKWTDIRPIRKPNGEQRIGIDLVQNKTGKVLWVPIGDSLVTLLSNTKRQHTHILTNRYAKGPWSYRGAAQAVLRLERKLVQETMTFTASDIQQRVKWQKLVLPMKRLAILRVRHCRQYSITQNLCVKLRMQQGRFRHENGGWKPYIEQVSRLNSETLKIPTTAVKIVKVN